MLGKKSQKLIELERQTGQNTLAIANYIRDGKRRIVVEMEIRGVGIGTNFAFVGFEGHPTIPVPKEIVHVIDHLHSPFEILESFPCCESMTTNSEGQHCCPTHGDFTLMSFSTADQLKKVK